MNQSDQSDEKEANCVNAQHTSAALLLYKMVTVRILVVAVSTWLRQFALQVSSYIFLYDCKKFSCD